MKDRARRLLVVQVAGLGSDLLAGRSDGGSCGLTFRPMDSVFPSVTCTAQASFRTALPPARHGMVANGFFARELARPLFWQQSAGLVDGPRIWSRARAAGRRVAMLFWQQSLGEAADMIVSPAPIHKHGGGMIQSCYSKPRELYGALCRGVGREFDLMQYWGPLASPRSSDWIAAATAVLLTDSELAPDLCLTYLPALDYDLQRWGPDHARSRRAFAALERELDQLLAAARYGGYDVLVFGDYAIGPVSGGAVFPNRALRDHGRFAVREIRGMAYPDFHESAAFAMVDHEVAHVYVKQAGDADRVRRALEEIDGVGAVLDAAAQEACGIRHARSGEFVVVAAAGRWFAYPWWEAGARPPDYARHVDIHNKPGYDPCELFFGWPPPSVSMDCRRIRGSHGRTGADRRACWAATCAFEQEPASLVELAKAVEGWLGAE